MFWKWFFLIMSAAWATLMLIQIIKGNDSDFAAIMNVIHIAAYAILNRLDELKVKIMVDRSGDSAVVKVET